MPYLSRSELNGIASAILSSEVDHRTLLAVLPAGYRSSLPFASNVADQVFVHLERMNATPPLDDGTVMLQEYLDQALFSLQQRGLAKSGGAEVIRSALDRIRDMAGRIPEPDLAAPRPAEPDPRRAPPPARDPRRPAQPDSVGVLHFSDLHAGQKGQLWLLPNVVDALEDDLERLHPLAGPWELLVFTGDLTQNGAPDDFAAFDGFLDRLLGHLARLGSSPAVLFVLGNHDLQRPTKADQLKDLVEQDRLPLEFWEQPTHPLRRPVAKAFQGWRAWGASRTRSPDIVSWTEGVLPGEFSASVRAGQRLVGVVGLNTAALHLWSGDRKEKLPLHPAQLMVPTAGDPRRWARQHDVCLLLTHHPASWLNPSGQRALTGEIYLPDRFAAHLAGHVHEESTVTWAYGGGGGRQQIVARSLFGLKAWEDGPGPKIRALGYSALRISFHDTHRELRIWPRSAVQDPGDHRWRIERAVTTHTLREEDGGSAVPIQILGPSPRPTMP